MRASRDLAGGDPPDSSRLRIGEDISWSDVNAVYDRDDSLKENTNPKCIIKNHHGGGGGGGGGGASQRFSGNLKPTAAPIIGISGKLGQSARRHPAGSVRIFPRKAKTGGGGRKSAVPDDEPGSPKVSCIGKVLSDRERERRRRRRSIHRLPSPSPERKPGCCVGISFLFRRGGARKGAVECVEDSPPAMAAVAPVRCRVPAAKPEVEVAAPGLGGMKRFASGRRAAEWTDEMDVDGHVSRSGPL